MVLDYKNTTKDEQYLGFTAFEKNFFNYADISYKTWWYFGTFCWKELRHLLEDSLKKFVKYSQGNNNFLKVNIQLGSGRIEPALVTS